MSCWLVYRLVNSLKSTTFTWLCACAKVRAVALKLSIASCTAISLVTSFKSTRFSIVNTTNGFVPISPTTSWSFSVIDRISCAKTPLLNFTGT